MTPTGIENGRILRQTLRDFYIMQCLNLEIRTSSCIISEKSMIVSSQR